MTKLEAIRDETFKGKEFFEAAMQNAKDEGFERFMISLKENVLLYEYFCSRNNLEDVKMLYDFGFNDACKLAFTDI